jgi:hypothetical protein
LKQSSQLSIIIIGVGSFIAAAIVLFIWIGIEMNMFCWDCDADGMIDHYIEKEFEIKDLNEYFKSNLPENGFVYVKIEEKKLVKFSVEGYGSWEANNRNIDNYRKMDSLLAILDWECDVLPTVKNKLISAKCYSINSSISSDRTYIGWKRPGLETYAYILFDSTLTKEQIAKHNDSCSYIYYKDNVVLYHGGGAIGPHCF